MPYKFNFDQMTIGDIAAFVGDSFQLRIIAIDRLTEGGIFHLSFTELQPVVDAFFKEYTAHLEKTAKDYAERHTLKDALANAKVIGE